MRRSNGAGGVFKLSGNRRKPWMARITVGWDEGKQLYKIIGYFATKAEAEIAISLNSVMPVSDNANITLKGLFEQWRKTRAYTELSYKTKGNYDTCFESYMTEYHNAKFADLRLSHFQGMVDKADKLGRSRSTMAKIKTLSVLLCNYANTQDIVMKSYAQQVRLPKADKKAPLPIFSETEIAKLVKNDTLLLSDAVLILIYTGMRVTELLTLTKFNVDIDNMVITGGIKTEAGTDRLIPIHPKIQKYVRARYDSAQNYLIEHEKEVGSKKKGTHHIEQSPYRYEHFCDIYYDTLDNLGIRRLSPHKARHTFFTLLSEKCKDRKAMALIGGHTDPDFTDRVYVQPDIDRLRRAIENL